MAFYEYSAINIFQKILAQPGALTHTLFMKSVNGCEIEHGLLTFIAT